MDAMHVFSIRTLQYADIDASAIPKTGEKRFSSAPDLHDGWNCPINFGAIIKFLSLASQDPEGKTHDSQGRVQSSTDRHRTERTELRLLSIMSMHAGRHGLWHMAQSGFVEIVE